MKSQKQERMVVFILGNGFDLAHGLKTKYTHFLDGYPKEELQKNIWFNHFNKKKEEIGENWFNIEEEIYKVLTKEINNRSSDVGSKTYVWHNIYKLTPDEIAKELYEGSIIIKKGYRAFKDIDFATHSLRFFVDQFGKYLSEQLDDLNLTPKPKFQEFLKNGILFNSKFHQYFSKIRIVNFNYTNTFEKLYSGYFCSEDGTLDISTYYVHGSINKNNLVLGTQDLLDLDLSYLYKNRDPRESPFRIFTKESQRFDYGTNKEYQKLLKELEETSRKSITFHIIGHSLDKADHKILNKILCYSGSEGNIGDINIYRYKDNESLEILKNIEKILQYTSCEERISLTPLETIIENDP